jgi:hypothetical protein
VPQPRPGLPFTQREETPTLSVDFAGGSIQEYIKVLSRASPDLNVVIRPETMEIPMPPVSLKGVAHNTALQLIPALADSPSEITVTPVGTPGEGSEVFVIGTQPPRWPANATTVGSPVVAGAGGPARMMHPTLQTAPGRPPKLVRVFSLKLLTTGPDSLKPETVLTAIDTALGLQEAGEPASLKLHSESGLLVVHGNPTQIDAVEQVLSAMERDRAKRGADQESALAGENKKLKEQVAALMARVAELEARVPIDSGAKK